MVLLTEKRICIYQGTEWQELTAQGYITSAVEDVRLPDGYARIAVMFRQRPLPPADTGTYQCGLPT